MDKLRHECIKNYAHNRGRNEGVKNMSDSVGYRRWVSETDMEGGRQRTLFLKTESKRDTVPDYNIRGYMASVHVKEFSC